MCGIAGYISSKEPVSEAVLKKMCEILKHRGPDSSDVWKDSSEKVGFAHTRLAIVDLSKDGAQPMTSSSGRYTICYNGEIYNHSELRKDLNRNFKGHSDTESLIEAIDEWGVEAVLSKINGMFAFSVWDSREKTAWLVRDRLGIKPLYYGWQANKFIFGSELKAFKALPDLSLDIDRDSLCLFLRHNYIPAPHSVYQSVFKLEAGSYLKLSLEDTSYVPESFSPHALPGSSKGPKKYWDIREKAQNGIINPFKGDERELNKSVRDLITDSIKIRLMSDVPLGLFLSGGIDSSVTTLLASEVSSSRIKTFSIGFNEDGFNEAQYAAQLAKALGTDHTELYLNAQDALDVIPKLPTMYDEPFSDSSQIPTYLVSKMAREDVTVCLSGDGGDETFCGYARYIWSHSFWSKTKVIPLPLRKLFAGTINNISESSWDSFYRQLKKIIPGFPTISLFGSKVHRFFNLLCLQNRDLLYRQMLTHWDNPEDVLLSGTEPQSLLQLADYKVNYKDFRDEMMYQDYQTYLPDDLLVKVDRAAMAVSLETRVPLIDYRLVELALSIPAARKVKGSKGKMPLRNILYDAMPKSFVDRPKQGFSVPVGQWLRNDLRDWAEDLLSEKKLEEYGVFNSKLIRQTWDEHLSGRKNRQYHLWDVLTLQSWMEESD